MRAVLGVFPDRKHAEEIKNELARRGLPSQGVATFSRDEIGRVEQLLSRITPATDRTKTGILVGLLAGGLFGLILGIMVFPAMANMDIPRFVFGLLGLFPFAVLGAYLGSLYGSRSATRHKTLIKHQVGKENAILIVVHGKPEEANAVQVAMEAGEGAQVFAFELDAKEIHDLQEMAD